MEIDARGLSCPQPVIETKKVVDKKREETDCSCRQYRSQGKCEQVCKGDEI